MCFWAFFRRNKALLWPLCRSVRSSMRPYVRGTFALLFQLRGGEGVLNLRRWGKNRGRGRRRYRSRAGAGEGEGAGVGEGQEKG